MLAVGGGRAVAAQGAAAPAAIPPHVEALLAEYGYVDVEVVVGRPDLGDAPMETRMAEVQMAIAELRTAPELASLEVRAEYETVPLAIMRLHSPQELTALAANPVVVEIGKTTMVASSALLQGSEVVSSTTARTGAYTNHAVGNLGRGVTIAVLDSGVDTDHIDLATVVTYEACFLRTAPSRCPNGADRQMGPGAAEDDFGHGTAVSSIIAGQGAVSPLGAAPEASLEVYKVLGSAGIGTFDEMLAALDHISASRPDVDVVNISASSVVQFPGPCDELAGAPVVAQMRAVVRDLRARGVIVVAAAGNQGSGNGMGFPACLTDVVSVAASEWTPTLAPFSNVSAITDVAAPGSSVVAAAIGGGTQVLSGTSFAAPLVSACVALFIGDPSTGPSGAFERLRTSPLSIAGTQFAVPWLNCYRRCDGVVPNRIVPWGMEGTSFDDVIIGSDDGEIIRGNGGSDRICGLGGDDLIVGGNAPDRIFGGDGADVIFGLAGNDHLDGGPGPDRMHGGFDRDVLLGGAGQDRLYGEEGSDFIHGEDQSDRLYGGSGDDWIEGAAGKDALYGEGGNDTLFGGVNTDYFDGGAGGDYANGGPGHDRPLIVDVSGCLSIERAVSC